MKTREQIIKAFEQCLVHGPGKCEDCYQDGPGFGIACWKNVCSDVLELLKEQEAKKVESIQISRNFGAELTGYCPSCNRPLKEQFNKCFCGNCGQAVKWDGIQTE